MTHDYQLELLQIFIDKICWYLANQIVKYSREPLWRGPILLDIALIITETEADYQLDAGSIKDITPYLALLGGL